MSDHFIINRLAEKNEKMGTFANSEYLDEMPQHAACTVC